MMMTEKQAVVVLVAEGHYFPLGRHVVVVVLVRFFLFGADYSLQTDGFLVPFRDEVVHD